MKQKTFLKVAKEGAGLILTTFFKDFLLRALAVNKTNRKHVKTEWPLMMHSAAFLCLNFEGNINPLLEQQCF